MGPGSYSRRRKTSGILPATRRLFCQRPLLQILLVGRQATCRSKRLPCRGQSRTVHLRFATTEGSHRPNRIRLWNTSCSLDTHVFSVGGQSTMSRVSKRESTTSEAWRYTFSGFGKYFRKTERIRRPWLLPHHQVAPFQSLENFGTGSIFGHYFAFRRNYLKIMLGDTVEGVPECYRHRGFSRVLPDGVTTEPFSYRFPIRVARGRSHRCFGRRRATYRPVKVLALQ